MTDDPTTETPVDEDRSSTTAPPPPPSGRPPLVRRSDDRILGGVASGIADWLDIDTTIVRIGFVVLGVMNGIGVIAYLAGWLLIPEDTDPAATAARHGRAAPARSTGRNDLRDRGPAFWIGIALLAIASIMIVSTLPVLRSFEAGPAIVLIAIGVALWQMSQRGGDRPSGPPDATAWMPPAADPTWPSTAGPTDPTVPTGTARSETVSASPTQSTAWTPPPVPGRRQRGSAADPVDRGLDWTPPPVPPRERSYLGRVVMAVALIVAGVLASLSVGGELAITTAGILSTVMLIIGLGLMIGSVLGRARWLALVGLILLPFVVATSFASSLDIDLGDGWGERTYYAIGGVEPSYELGAGQLVLDFADLEPDGRTRSTTARLGAGELVVYVPSDVDIVLDASANLGELEITGEILTGQGLERQATIPAMNAEGRLTEPRGELELDLSVGVGRISVVQVPIDRGPAEEFTR